MAESSLSRIRAAESSLFCIAESLKAKISTSYIEQVSQDIGVYRDLNELRETLTLVQDVLLDAENRTLNEWLMGRIKQVLCDAENIVDEFRCQMLQRQVVNNAHDTTYITKVGRFFSSSNPLVSRLFMTKQFKDITKRLHHCALQLKDIIESLKYASHEFGLPKLDVDSLIVHKRDMTLDYVNESDVIGREIDKDKIIQKLLMEHHDDSNCDDPRFSIIPIVGMEGVGKTTLAQLVFNDWIIRISFPLRMWVCVSDDFDINEVISDCLINSVDTRHAIIEQQANYLRNKLAMKKFLLVLDGVSDEHLFEENEVSNLMSKVGKGSKILVTTRSYTVASTISTIPFHRLEALSLEDSLSLLEKCAFQGERGKYPALIKVGREIVNQCGGIPLAIKSLGRELFSKHEIDDELESSSLESLRELYSKHEIDELEFISNNKFEEFPELYDTFRALKLSYHYMPSHLKQCFEMFSLYPNDFVFHSFEVASLWAALGLLPSPNKDETLIDVANRYLHELMSRSFLHNFFNFGTSYYFQIHDLVHNFARHIAKDECLMVNSNDQVNVQHISFAENDFLGKSLPLKPNVVRTILFPIEGAGASSEAFLNMCISRYRYLRILDLSDSTYEMLPRSISKLRHLRFLSLERNEKIKRIPDSICMLQNLHVLNLVGCTKLEKLPKGLRNLISLRQLGITTKESTLPENDIASLNSLEILNIESCDNLESFFEEIKLLTLKTLTVTNCASLKSVPLDSNHFPQLETLLVDNCGYLELTNGHDDQNSNLQLKAIRLYSLPQLVKLPRWLQKSTNKLQSLLIVDCKNLEGLPEWLSTLSFLGSFSLVNCPKLISLPNDIHRLTALGYLRIEDCPELCRKCRPQVGEYWPKICHIKQIFINEPENLKYKSIEEEQ